MRRKSISYAKWGYIFTAPFFIAFFVFNLIPLVSTMYNSFFENYLVLGTTQVGPNWVGLKNYSDLFAGADLGKFFLNTLILQMLGFIPQIFFSLLFASWFTDLRLKLKTGAYKIIFYMPNVIMAAAMGMLFFTLFSQSGPINSVYQSITGAESPYMFFDHVWTTRGIISLINFLMWYGNTTIMLMAAINGIDPSLYESAQIDGANPTQTFWKITIPLIRPILVYVLITSLIGGLQMFDVPQIVTNGGDALDRSSMTIVMYLNKHLYSKNYGMAGALSVLLFIVAGILSMLIFMLNRDSTATKKKKRKGGKK
ncbi:MAG: sugar ABC transporter permease [Ruminococcus sp.]|nr:sugar ABC transporter permease [Ruminococcus sp.]